MRYKDFKILKSVLKESKFYMIFTLTLRKYQDNILHHRGLFNGTKYIKLLNQEDTNILIIEKISLSDPFMISRYENVEFYTLTAGKDVDTLSNNAGFFPKNMDLVKKFRYIYNEVAKEIDILGIGMYKYERIFQWSRKSN